MRKVDREGTCCQGRGINGKKARIKMVRKVHQMEVKVNKRNVKTRWVLENSGMRNGRGRTGGKGGGSRLGECRGRDDGRRGVIKTSQGYEDT